MVRGSSALLKNIFVVCIWATLTTNLDKHAQASIPVDAALCLGSNGVVVSRNARRASDCYLCICGTDLIFGLLVAVRLCLSQYLKEPETTDA